MLSLDEYKAMYDASPDGCLVVGPDGVVRSANPRVEEIFGWRADALVGQAVEVLIPNALGAAHQEHRLRYAANPHTRPMGVGMELQGRRKDGSLFPVEVSLSPWRHHGGELRIICAVRDVSAHRRLQNFSEGALRASEEERARIARELHDDTAQRLATLILRVRVLAQEPDLAARLDLLERVRDEIVEAAEGVKRMSRGLRPPELEELGLPLALQAHVRSLNEAPGFVVTTDLGHVDPHLDVTAKLALYRIVQEALSNARRHSRAASAHVKLALADGVVSLEVSDAGVGFVEPSASDGTRGLGLVGMQERAMMIGGRLTVETGEGDGTTVRVTVPQDHGGGHVV